MGAEIFTNFVFLSIISATDARKPFKGSKDADFGLVSNKILSQNTGSMGWGPGPGNGGQIKVKTPPLVAGPPREPQTENEKRFFSISTRRLAESVDGFDSSLAQSAGELWSCRGRAKKMASAGLKGI